MITRLLALVALTGSFTLSAQTYFYIDAIAVNPSAPTTADNISIDLSGGLSSTGAYVIGASAEVSGSVVTITIAAADPGGFTVIVPHTETVPVGQLAAGAYTIVLNTTAVADFAPVEEHQFVVSGGLACDSLEILSVLWSAFDDSTLVAHVNNHNTDNIFSYPNFILFDGDHDTLAVETVGSFALVGESWHSLHVHPNAQMPGTVFTGTLEVWTLFTQELDCSETFSMELCPPAPCAMLVPTIRNLGDAIPIGTYDWTIYDADFTEVANGSFSLGLGHEFDSDTICLPPGAYNMICDPNDPPTGGAPYFGISAEGFQAGPQQPVVWSLPMYMPFNFYLPCAEGPNSVREHAILGLALRQTGDQLTLESTDGRALGSVRLFDAQGRLLLLERSSSRTLTLSTAAIAPGLVVIQSEAGAGRVMVMR